MVPCYASQCAALIASTAWVVNGKCRHDVVRCILVANLWILVEAGFDRISNLAQCSFSRNAKASHSRDTTPVDGINNRGYVGMGASRFSRVGVHAFQQLIAIGEEDSMRSVADNHCK